MKTCVDCGCEIKQTRSPRCTPCRTDRRKSQWRKSTATNRKKLKAKGGSHGKRHCDRCSTLYRYNTTDSNGLCPECSREDSLMSLDRWPTFRWVKDQWLSNKPITKVCQHEY